MKKLFILAFGTLALIPVVSSTAVPGNAAATTVAQTSELAPELLQTLKAQAASGTLSRPL
jgi:hypothetical protein